MGQENQAISFMITDWEKWHYLAVTKLSTLLKEIFMFNFLYLFRMDKSLIGLKKSKEISIIVKLYCLMNNMVIVIYWNSIIVTNAKKLRYDMINVPIDICKS